MRFAIIDINGPCEHISAAWNERDRAQDVADELNAELGCATFAVVPIEEEEHA